MTALLSKIVIYTHLSNNQKSSFIDLLILWVPAKS